MKRELKGIGVPDLHLENIRKIKIPLPEIKIQNKIVEIMRKAYDGKKQKENEAQELIASIDEFILTELGITLPKIEDKKVFTTQTCDLFNNRFDTYYHQPKLEEVANKLLKLGICKPVNEFFKDIISGQRPKGGVSQIEMGIPSLGGEHVLPDGSIAAEKLKYIPEEFHQTQLKSRIKLLDIILVKDGATTGKAGIIPKDYPHTEANINEHVFILRARQKYNPHYLFAFLKSNIGQIQIKREITGATITGITRDALSNILIPDARKDIQDKIASEYQNRMSKAKQLQEQAKVELEQAKIKVKKIILGEQ